MPFYLIRPDAAFDGKRPVLIIPHGHGGGKHAVLAHQGKFIREALEDAKCRLLERAAEHLVGLTARGAVIALEKAGEHGARHLLAAEFELHAGHELGILADELVLLDHVWDDLLAHRLAGDLQRAEEHRRELFLQLRTEGRIEHGGGERDHIVVELRPDLVVIILFGDVELVDRVDRIAHVGEASRGHEIPQHRQIFLARGEDLVGAPGLLDAADHILHHGRSLLDRDALVGQGGYFHGFLLPFYDSGRYFTTIREVFQSVVFKAREI